LSIADFKNQLLTERLAANRQSAIDNWQSAMKKAPR
jgi:hypothetical protein